MDTNTQLWTGIKTWIHRLLVAVGALSIIGLVAALVIPDPDAPSQGRYQKCLERVAEKANGSTPIFNSLRHASCEALRPQPAETRLFSDHLPEKKPAYGTKPQQHQQSAEEFLNQPNTPSNN
ncbi:MAG: hypothetical protein U1D29_12845 [Burkholderiales bacterium]|nr:hypothetical protein [Burkholderiales bacterium]